jgi:hypothetical protein
MQSEEPSHHLMREAISEATREAIRCIQMKIEAIGGNQRQSEAIRCNQALEGRPRKRVSSPDEGGNQRANQAGHQAGHQAGLVT